MSEPTIETALATARDRIARPGGWTQRAYARDADGNACDFAEPSAACFCSLGAISAEALPLAFGPFSNLGRKMRDSLARVIRDSLGLPEGIGLPRDLIARWNDARGRTQSEVVAMFDKAIEAEKAKAAQ